MRTKLFDLEIDTLSFSDAIEFAMDLIEQQKASQVVTINPEMFETANHNINFRKIVDESELIIPLSATLPVVTHVTQGPFPPFSSTVIPAPVTVHCAVGGL